MAEETERLHDALDGRISTILINRTNNSFKGRGRHFLETQQACCQP